MADPVREEHPLVTRLLELLDRDAIDHGSSWAWGPLVDALRRVVLEHRTRSEVGQPLHRKRERLCDSCAGGGGYNAPWPCPTFVAALSPYTDEFHVRRLLDELRAEGWTEQTGWADL